MSILHVTQNGEDKSIVDFTTLMRKINWTIVMLLGGVAPIRAALALAPGVKTANCVGKHTDIIISIGSIPMAIPPLRKESDNDDIGRIQAAYPGRFEGLAHSFLLSNYILQLFLSEPISALF